MRTIDLITEVRRREGLNRARRSLLLAIGVTLSALAVYLLTLSAYPRWLTWLAVITLAGVYLFWILPKGVKFNSVTDLEAGSLIDARFGTKERAISLVELRQVGGEADLVVAGVIERQLGDLLPGDARAHDVVSFQPSKAEIRALLVGGVALVLAILALYLNVSSSDPLRDLLAEIEAVQGRDEQRLSRAAMDALTGLHDKVSMLVRAGASSESIASAEKWGSRGDVPSSSSAQGELSELGSEVVRELEKVKGILAREHPRPSDGKGERSANQGEDSGAQRPSDNGENKKQSGTTNSASGASDGVPGAASNHAKGDSGQEGQGAKEGASKDSSESNSASNSEQGAQDAGGASDSEGGAGEQDSGDQDSGETGKNKGASRGQEGSQDGDSQNKGGGQGENSKQKQDGEGVKSQAAEGGGAGDGSQGEGEGEGEGKRQGQVKGGKQGGGGSQSPAPSQGSTGSSGAEGANSSALGGSEGRGGQDGERSGAQERSDSKGARESKDSGSPQGALDKLDRAIERAEGALKGGSSNSGKGESRDDKGNESSSSQPSQPVQPERSEPGSSSGSGERSPGIDRNAKPRKYDPQGEVGGEGANLGGGRGFKEVKIEARMDEKFDERFIGRDSSGDIGEAKVAELPVQPRSGVEDVSLAKPKMMPRRGEQPIPLEYRDRLK